MRFVKSIKSKRGGKYGISDSCASCTVVDEPIIDFN